MQVTCKQREQIPASFMGRKREHPPKNRGISASASPPKAEATGSNPVGCASFLRTSELRHNAPCRRRMRDVALVRGGFPGTSRWSWSAQKSAEIEARTVRGRPCSSAFEKVSKAEAQ